MQVPTVRATPYGVQSAQTMAAFDANNAQRRMAETEALGSILSNAESAQNVFGGEALGRLMVATGGISPDLLSPSADFIAQSDYINQGQRNADVINTLAQASERMPDHIVSPGSFANGQLPQIGAPMQGHVDAGDRAAFANADAIRAAAMKANVDPDTVPVLITNAAGETIRTTMNFDTFQQTKNAAAADGTTVQLDFHSGAPLTNTTNKAATPEVTGPAVDLTAGGGGDEPAPRTPVQPAPVDMTGGGGQTTTTVDDQGTQDVRNALGRPDVTVYREGNNAIVKDQQGNVVTTVEDWYQ